MQTGADGASYGKSSDVIGLFVAVWGSQSHSANDFSSNGWLFIALPRAGVHLIFLLFLPQRSQRKIKSFELTMETPQISLETYVPRKWYGS